jgi:aryl-alcohol dehydrogenase-like predicted oxidoreductase
MEYRYLGRSGLRVSKICLGCMNLGDAADETESFAMVDLAMEQGVNFYDTANGYGGGRSEEVLGAALARDGKRDAVVVATKVHFPVDPDDPNSRGNSRRHIIEQCDASLKRLRTDRIDLYQLHRASPEIPVEETLMALDDLIRAGKVRYIGTSTWPAWRVTESIYIAKQLGTHRFIAEQPPYHMLDSQLEKTLIPMAISYGVGIIPWSPLAGGMLTGKHLENEHLDGTRLGGDDEWSRWHRTPAAFAVVRRVREIAARHQATPTKIALAWNAAQPGITSPIIGPKSVDQLKDNLGAAEITLTSDDFAGIDQVAPPGESIVPYIWSPWVSPDSFRPHQYR